MSMLLLKTVKDKNTAILRHITNNREKWTSLPQLATL